LVKGDASQIIDTALKRSLQVLLIEEPGVAKARDDHSLHAAHNLGSALTVRVGNGSKPVNGSVRHVANWNVFLMMNEHRSHDVSREFLKLQRNPAEDYRGMLGEIRPLLWEIGRSLYLSVALREPRVELSSNSLDAFIAITIAVSLLVALCIVFIAANTASMSVRERVGEIAILKAIGFRKYTIFSTLLAEAVVLSTVAGIAGALISFGLTSMLRSSAGTSGPQMGPMTGFIVTDAIAIQAVFIAFLPNAAYTLSDIIHFVEEVKSQPTLPVWSVVYVIIPKYAVFMFLGFQSHVVSLILAGNYLRWIGHNRWVLPAELLLNFLCAVGVYWGRYLRFNSWEIVSNPFRPVALDPHWLTETAVGKYTTMATGGAE
jgi:hypothetical protein